MNQRIPRPPSDASDGLERHLYEDAESFPYPPTPNVAVRTPWRTTHGYRFPVPRRMLWVAVILLVLLCGLLSVPQVRAAIFQILRIGGISIVPATVSPLPTPVSSITDLAGATTLEEAQTALKVPIRIPAYPTALGQPDKVFLQQSGGLLIILVWVDKTHPEQAKLSLHILGPNTYGDKFSPQIIEQTTVHGQPALWTQGAHVLAFVDGNGTSYHLARLVNGNVLIWTEDTLTYRLETDLSLAEAIKIAESLH